MLSAVAAVVVVAGGYKIRYRIDVHYRRPRFKLNKLNTTDTPYFVTV